MYYFPFQASNFLSGRQAMDTESAVVLQLPLSSLIHQRGNIPLCPPALHLEQLQHPLPTFHWYYTCGEEVKALKNMDEAALENLFPSGRCRHHQKASARTKRQHWTVTFSPKSSAEDMIPTFTLSTTSPFFDQYCPLTSTAERKVLPDH